MEQFPCSDTAGTGLWPLVDALHDEADGGEDMADEEGGTPALADGITAAGAAPDAGMLATLVSRIVDQDQAALAELYDALSGRVFASAWRITRQVAAAEEATQDTFWQVWRQAPRFDPQRGGAAAWVLNIARSRALDHVRRLQRQRLSAQALAHTHPDPTAGDPQDMLAGLQRDSRLQLLLAHLDPLKRQLIALAYFRGLTQDEISLHTGMPLGTVKSHLRRTLAVLRATLHRDGSTELDSCA